MLGFDGVPEAGEHVRVVEHERRARQLAGERATRLKAESLARRSGKRVSLENIFRRGLQELNLVLKADVAGSLEAIEDEIAKLPQDEVSVNVIRRAVGAVTESDVMLAAASDAVILAFNVRPVGDARAVAEREGVEIRHYSVIYRAIEELRSAMQGMLAPEEVEEALGSAEVRQIFRASRVGTIAGSHVTEGKITRGSKVRLVRDGTVIYDGEIAQPAALQRGRARGRRRLRLRHRAQGLRRRQGRRRARDLRHAPGRARARLAGRALPAERLRRRARDRAALSRRRQPQGQAQGAVVDQGPAARPARRRGGRDRPPGPVAARDADRGADRRLAAPRCTAAADEVERWLIARCPDGVAGRTPDRLGGGSARMSAHVNANRRAEGRMAAGRMRRVDEAMRAVLSDAIAKDLKDPRVGFVTVTGVKTSPDLRHARVYVSVLGDDPTRAASLDGLRSAHGFLQRRLAAELTLKHTPSLTFEYDESVDRGMRITRAARRERSGGGRRMS